MRWNNSQGKPVCRFHSGSGWIDPSSLSSGYAYQAERVGDLLAGRAWDRAARLGDAGILQRRVKVVG